ncbi:hypothetical protein BY458DRAFT_430710 [Sporodiniella umbellata]|nr:hypothetical protein BY458DRAFT_430710 [Sporodiniella umbellata]
MVKIHPVYADTVEIFYSCLTCHSQLTSHQDIISKAFQGRHGPAFLVQNTINTAMGDNEKRLLMTGVHTIADISCQICQTRVGWKYVRTPEASQKYKEGRYLIEKSRVIKESLFL